MQNLAAVKEGKENSGRVPGAGARAGQPAGTGVQRAQRGEQVMLTRVGLQIPKQLSYAEWENAGRRLSGIMDLSLWCLGDWLVYGKQHYADRYRTAIQAAGLQYQTLRNYAWVAHRFELRRRRPALTFQHHAEVASMPPEEQDRWLDLAERNSWTTKKLRTSIRSERAGGTLEDMSFMPRIEVPGASYTTWQQAADRAGIEFKDWVMHVLDSAAAEALDDAGAAAARLSAGQSSRDAVTIN